MTRSAIRLSFCVAAAVIAAALADPLMESVSNAGWFGPGRFTDHSSLDVIPAILAGCALVLIQLVLRVRELLRASDRALSVGAPRLLPVTFAVQIASLFGMETGEQMVAYGHPLGGTVWLGGPVLVSLAVHAFACVLVLASLAAGVRVLAATAARAIKLIRALTTLPSATASLTLARRDAPVIALSVRALRSAGERSPPLLAV